MRIKLFIDSEATRLLLLFSCSTVLFGSGLSGLRKSRDFGNFTNSGRPEFGLNYP